jgi:SAM-dependent methyltransferase
MELSSIITDKLQQKDVIWYSESGGSWSLIAEQDTTQKILKDLSKHGCRETIRRNCPQFEDLTFSLKRAAGVGILDFQESDIVVDVGCNWGALSELIARTGCKVLCIDQTKESLLFLKKRLDESGLDNVDLVCTDLRGVSFKDYSVDKFIVNGVLEWIPETINVAFKKDSIKENRSNNVLRKILNYYRDNQSPLEIQQRFLKKLHKALKKEGLLYLAIENRFDVSFFLGFRDPHTSLRFVNILPRFLQIPYSFLLLGRPFLTWIYSERELKKLLYSSGFSNVSIMYAYPDYRFPDLILSDKGLKDFYPCRFKNSRRKRGKIVWWFLENIFYKILRAKSLSPSFIVIAHK